MTWCISYHIIFTYHIFLFAISYFYWHILPYYYLLLLLLYYYLPQINLPIYFYSNQVYDKQRKNLSPWRFVCDVCHALKNFFPMMAFCNITRVVGKKIFLSPTMVNASLISQFRENVVSFNFRANTLKITLRAEHCSKLLTTIT